MANGPNKPTTNETQSGASGNDMNDEDTDQLSNDGKKKLHCNLLLSIDLNCVDWKQTLCFIINYKVLFCNKYVLYSEVCVFILYIIENSTVYINCCITHGS